jgi:hypothetical protein
MKSGYGIIILIIAEDGCVWKIKDMFWLLIKQRWINGIGIHTRYYLFT